MKWYEDISNVVDFAEWLDGQCYFNDTTAVIRLFEKPWKWTTEYEMWRNGAASVEEIEEAIG